MNEILFVTQGMSIGLIICLIILCFSIRNEKNKISKELEAVKENYENHKHSYSIVSDRLKVYTTKEEEEKKKIQEEEKQKILSNLKIGDTIIIKTEIVKNYDTTYGVYTEKSYSGIKICDISPSREFIKVKENENIVWKKLSDINNIVEVIRT